MDASSDDWRTSTAERPGVGGPVAGLGGGEPTVVPVVHDEPTQASPGTPPTGPAGPATPPPVYETPPRARYPMYADDPALTAPPTPADPPAWEAPAPPVEHDRRRGPAPWLVVAIALVLVAGVGVFLLTGGLGSGDDDVAADRTPASDAGRPSAEQTGGAGGSDEPAPSETEPPPSSEPTEPGSDAPIEPRDVTTEARVVTPVTAPPGQDVRGNPVRYDADNMLDGRPDTAWRMPGDGTGATITFTFPSPTRLTSVGLLNGYAKRDPGYDGYLANRRITAVEWIFSDGTRVSQSLGNARQVQPIDVDTVTTTVVLRLVSVSAPGRGPSGRDYTAVSDVSLVGEAA
ncbi:hypothetical protein ABFT23_14475 [Nocardioides sp. C4-1]|uniref:NADase-type glycan-binding domain-containing protein n=1 Tax=Nocardioides sp. C4-1 TaxID=3151851 RepID=UPI003265023A